MQTLTSHRLTMLTSTDPAETVRHLGHYLFADYKISPVGRSGYLARGGGFKLGCFSFALMESNAPILMEAKASANHYVMSSCLRGSADLCVDGKTVRMSEGSGFVSRPSRLSASFSSNCARLVVRFDADALNNVPLPEGGEFSLSSPGIAAWHGQVQGLLSSPSLMDAVERDEGARSHMERLLFALLSSKEYFSHGIRRQTLVASRDVRRADVFMRSNFHRDISLADIVAAAGVATRTLQSNFMRYRTTTPMQYLLRIRLEAARERLMGADERSSVTSVAFDSGFKHLNHFASLYRMQYGELPSATLRRRVSGPRLRFRTPAG